MKTLSFLLVVSASIFSYANNSNIDDIIEGFREKTEIPGICVSVTTKNTVLHKNAYGFKDLENNLPATTNTLFQVGSISKSFTAILTAILEEEGLVKFDDKLSDLIPFFTHNDEITLRDYLSHQSGYGAHDALWINKRYSRNEMVEKLRFIPQELPHRRAFNYQNNGYMLAAHALECVTGKSWEELLSEKILSPLHLDNTYLDLKDMLAKPDFAYGYSDHIHPNKRLSYLDPHTIAPAGGMCMNIEDLTTWTQFLLKKGAGLVYENTFEELCTPQIFTNLRSLYNLDKYIQMEGYGMGFFVIIYQGYKIIFHAGNIDGFSSLVAFLPEQNFGISILTNKDHSLSPLFMTVAILEEYFELERLNGLETYVALRKELKKGAIAKKELSFSSRKADTVPTHLLSDYTGVYTHPAYGEMEISLVGNDLKGTYNDMVLPLEHWHHGVFSATSECPLVHCHGVKFNFSSDFEGEIDGVRVLFKEQDGPIHFTKKVSDKLKSEEYLDSLAGVYQTGIIAKYTTITIERSNDHLTANVGGKAKFKLSPEKMHTFSVDKTQRGWEGYIIQFLPNNSNEVDSVKLITPHGITVTADKKESN
ncbi:serine hydrolase [bacterium]|nr:serine hydrolase [bacterium]